MNNPATGQSTRPDMAWLKEVATPKIATDTSDDASALESVMPVANIRPGTMRNPPPIPKKPAAKPVTTPIGASLAAKGQVIWMSGSPSLRGRRNIETAIPAMAKAKQSSRRLPSTCLARLEPSSEPIRPAAAKTLAHGHFTRPPRQWPRRLLAALKATAAVEVPMTTCGSRTPTT
jgi:hypothetical protein